MVSRARKRKLQYLRLNVQLLPAVCWLEVGNKEYYNGKQVVFKAEAAGILYLGPYEWGDYLDNDGSVTIIRLIVLFRSKLRSRGIR